MQGAELSVIVPTFNERDNALELVGRLHSCLADYDWEVIFVDDDSPDETAELVREIASSDRRVRCIQRIGRRGLSSACVEGMLASSAPFLAVIDGDLQHDESLLPDMLELLKEDDTEIVIGSRYMADGGIGDWSQSRAKISRLATRLSKMSIKSNLSDPMSGFFMLRRSALNRCVRNLSGIGFKILIDLFASSPKPLKFKELPYEFRVRTAGESKLDSQAVWSYLMLLLDKLVGHLVPARFIAFCFVGGVGVFVHFSVLWALLMLSGGSFVTSHSIATVVAMTSNFWLNNILTYSDMRLKGWKWIQGWISFSIACSIGAITNVGIAAYLVGHNTEWPLAAFAGILVGTVWNYAATSIYTWRTPKSL